MSSFNQDDSPIHSRSELIHGQNEYNCPSNNRDCNHFPLLELPDTVLSGVLRLVSRDERRVLSQTSQRLRSLVVNNRSTSMDRRRTMEEANVYVLEPCRLLIRCHKPEVFKIFDNLPSFEKYIGKLDSMFFAKELNLHLCYGCVPETLNLCEIVESVYGLADCVVGCYSGGRDRVIEQLIDVFMKYPKVGRIEVVGLPFSKWKEYCTTVSQWANFDGVGVKGGVMHDGGLSIIKTNKNEKY